LSWSFIAHHPITMPYRELIIPYQPAAWHYLIKSTIDTQLAE
jgi:hypothetical protein